MTQMNSELVKLENNQLIINEEFKNKLIQFNQLKKEMEYQESLLKSELVELMPKIGKDEEPIIMDGIMISYKKGYTRTSIDSSKLKKEKPEIFEEYQKESKVNPTVIIKVAE